MFETGAPTAEYGQAEYSQGEYGEYGEGEGEYGQGEYGQGEYGEGEYGQGEYGQGEYNEGEYGEYGEGEGEYGEGEGEYSEGEGEEQFLPLIPVVGKVLGGLLGGLMKEGEYGEGEYGEYGEGEVGEAEEQFLHKILGKVLGGEAEVGELPLTEAQENEFAGRLLEVSNEQELDHFLGGLVNTIGRAVQGIGRAASSPQGQALIGALKPLAKVALPALGGAIGTAIAPGIGTTIGGTLGAAASKLFESESSGMNPEQEEFDTARKFVRLAATAAQDVASAPPGAPAELVGELSIFRAARRVAPSLYRHGLRSISPLARHVFGRSYSRSRYPGRRYGSPYRGGYRPGWRGYSHPGYGSRRYWPPRYRSSYGYPSAPYAGPGPEPMPEPPPSAPPGPPQPGFRWVAVPLGQPDPTPPPPPEPAPGAEPPAAPAGADGAAPPQSEYGRYRGYGGRRRGRGYGGYGSSSSYSSSSGGDGDGTGGSGRWIRRSGKIILLDV
ncbi:hypothetical protein AB0L70_04760 [Kribbella sp. NPDC051952]|uniref:hypothetical protein n=1 Tax=Kribbella sp. NPDC051952 TaxID=3154851 RepID=UPI00341D7143